MVPVSVTLLLALLAFFPAQGDKYAGDAACLSCHREQSDPYQHTAHHLTSQPANKDSILGSFTCRVECADDRGSGNRE